MFKFGIEYVDRPLGEKIAIILGCFGYLIFLAVVCYGIYILAQTYL